MLNLFTYLAFFISAAMAAGGIILASRLRKKHHNEISAALLYFQIFIFTFGFYGFWGQVVIKAFLAPYITNTDLLIRFYDISILLGLPFLVFAWLMLIRLVCDLSGRRCSNWFILGFLVFNFALVVTIGYMIARSGGIKPAILLKTFFIVINLISATVSYLILYSASKNSIMKHPHNRIVAAALMFIMAAQCIAVYFYEGHPVVGLLVIVAFFTGNAFLPVYLTYGVDLKPVVPVIVQEMFSFDEFFRKFDISPREKDIIREICNGLTNQEIADKLFISLQTVKDHTHRIYIKTNVKSRAQLMNLVKGGGV